MILIRCGRAAGPTVPPGPQAWRAWLPGTDDCLRDLSLLPSAAQYSASGPVPPSRRPMMLLTTTALVALQVLPQGLALPDTGGCSSDLECHLNGRCVGGLCHCNPAWAAVPNCSVMAVLPGRAEAHQRFGSNESSSWGRSVVDDSTDSRPSRATKSSRTSSGRPAAFDQPPAA